MQVVPQLDALSAIGNGINEVPQHSIARVEYAVEAEYGVNEQVQDPSYLTILQQGTPHRLMYNPHMPHARGY